jgi:hypothetical protein
MFDGLLLRPRFRPVRENERLEIKGAPDLYHVEVNQPARVESSRLRIRCGPRGRPLVAEDLILPSTSQSCALVANLSNQLLHQMNPARSATGGAADGGAFDEAVGDRACQRPRSTYNSLRPPGVQEIFIMQERLIVLLTATIDLQNLALQSKRSSPEIRLADYQEALRFWDQLDDPRIAGLVICENSGAREIDGLAGIARNKDVEILSYVGEEAPPGLHYGYRELGAIDYACSHSRLIRGHRLFLKATGRLRFPNVSQLLDALPEGLDCALDTRRAYPREGGPRFRARTQLILFARVFYEEAVFGKRDGMIGVCSHLEEWLPHLLTPRQQNRSAAVALRFPVECEIAGAQGSHDRSYAAFGPALKRRVRSALRTAAPGLWL